jgi:DMSO/TMAO reductase YedYZ molybdopterin-dependent catalytic subunit
MRRIRSRRDPSGQPTGGEETVGPDGRSDSASGPETRGTPIGRRVVLGMVGLGAVGILVGKRVQSVISDALAPIQAADPTGLTQLVPAGGGFRFYTITDSFPSKSVADYRLEVTGLVRNPMTLTVDDLRAMPPTSLVRDFQCVTGWRVPDVHWTGVSLGYLLDAAGVQPSGRALRFHSFDGADTESLTLAQARRPDVIVAYEMLGGPVTRDHGGPVRLYVAPMYGYKSLKWLDGIEVTDHVIPGYWEQNGYDVDGWIGNSNGRDDKPVR